MKIFGILNLTPDSFSDGGEFISTEKAVAQARKMMDRGALAIDIGAESTRPDAELITPEVEWQRLKPVLNSLSSPYGSTIGSPRKDPAVKPQDDVVISIDTRNPTTARRALQYNNVKYLNDVSGFTNPEMLAIAANAGVHIIAMHSLSVPADKDITLTAPPVKTLLEWFSFKLIEFTKSGIDPEKIIFDPGIGFGKTPEQSRELIKHAPELARACHKLGCRILYGHSRKSFLGGDIASRDVETAEISRYLQSAGVDYIRVHNIELNQF